MTRPGQKPICVSRGSREACKGVKNPLDPLACGALIFTGRELIVKIAAICAFKVHVLCPRKRNPKDRRC
jgi:hypothetical protein